MISKTQARQLIRKIYKEELGKNPDEITDIKGGLDYYIVIKNFELQTEISTGYIEDYLAGNNGSEPLQNIINALNGFQTAKEKLRKMANPC